MQTYVVVILSATSDIFFENLILGGAYTQYYLGMYSAFFSLESAIRILQSKFL
jgi:hypothetical protein